MYYVYYCGTGLITAIIYGLLVYGAAKLIIFLVPVFISIFGLLFLLAITKNGMKKILLKSTFIKLKYMFNDKKVYQFYYVNWERLTAPT